MDSIPWENFGGSLLEFDDGHVPENLPPSTATQIVDYPDLFSRQVEVQVYANAMPETLVDRIYQKTTSPNTIHPSWGSYVTMEQIETFWNKNNHINNNKETNNEDDDIVEMTARYLQLALGKGGVPPTQQYPCTTTTTPSLWTRSGLLSKAHGVAVWALSAKEGSQVPYHLDYAELLRYQTNIIVPPLLAGTLQCTRSKFQGGDFLVSLEGIPHYQTHGYKTKKCPIVDETTMIRIPYQFNQLTCHLGNLPHSSSRIEKIYQEGKKRVIVGFNVFGHDVGPLVQPAPEHSNAFRRQVQAQKRNNNNNNNKNISFQALKHNKPLTNLLVLAKRQKIKQAFQQAQEQLAQEIPKQLPTTVQHLMDLYGNNNNDNNNVVYWPTSPVDIQVYLYHKIKEGNYRILVDDDDDDSRTTMVEKKNRSTSEKDLVSPLATIDLASS